MTTASTGPTSAAAASSSSSATGMNKVKRVSLLEQPVVFDLTEQTQVEGEAKVCMVSEPDEFYGCCDIGIEELARTIPLGVPWVEMDMDDSETSDEARVHVVKSSEAVEQGETVVVTLDSGADVSVAPETYGAHGEPGSRHRLRMVNAQGAQIASSGNRKLRLPVMTRDGKQVEFVEDFALGGVSHPLMSTGKLLRQAWSVQLDELGEPFIQHASGVEVSARLDRNSLVMDARICVIDLEGDCNVSEANGGNQACNVEAESKNEGNGPVGFSEDYEVVIEVTEDEHEGHEAPIATGVHPERILEP